jgi:hypothetical protein
VNDLPSQYEKAKRQANYVYARATRSKDFKPGLGHVLTEPSFLLLGKEEETKNLLTYIEMLLNERGCKLEVVDI